MRVLWITFIPSPYRLKFFEALGKNCDLTVLFERSNSKNRKSHWDDFAFNGYKGIILKGITIGGYDKLCLEVGKHLNKSYDRIVISDPTSPTGIYASALLQLKKIPYIVESDGAFPTGKKNFKLFLKKFVMSKADICLSTAKLHDEYYLECGVKKEKIRRYPFTSIGEEDINIANEFILTDKRILRKKVDITERYMVLSVGRFSYNNGYGKGYDILLEIANKYKGKDVGFYIVGDDPTPEFTKLKSEKKLENVHFVGYKNKDELADYYASADVFVLLTRGDVWGLVVNEAMMYGLPVITTNRCIAGIEMVEDDINGYIVSLNNIQNIIDKINILLNDKCLRKKISANNIKKTKNYTFESMAEKHIKILNAIKND